MILWEGSERRRRRDSLPRREAALNRALTEEGAKEPARGNAVQHENPDGSTTWQRRQGMKVNAGKIGGR